MEEARHQALIQQVLITLAHAIEGSSVTADWFFTCFTGHRYLLNVAVLSLRTGFLRWRKFFIPSVKTCEKKPGPPPEKAKGPTERPPTNHPPAILNTAKIHKRPTRSNAALSIRISCVLGSTYCHTRTQSAAIRHMRKTKDIMLPNIRTL